MFYLTEIGSKVKSAIAGLGIFDEDDIFINYNPSLDSQIQLKIKQLGIVCAISCPEIRNSPSDVNPDNSVCTFDVIVASSLLAKGDDDTTLTEKSEAIYKGLHKLNLNRLGIAPFIPYDELWATGMKPTFASGINIRTISFTTKYN